MYTDAIAQRITDLCKEKGISINQLLQETKLNKSFVDNLKKGSIPSVDKISIVAEYFGVSVDYLLGKEEKHSEPEVLPDKNVIRILGRDGRRIEKHLTDEQMQALQVLIDQLPDAPDDL